MTTRRRYTARRLALTALAAVAIPLSSLTFAQSAAAVGDVCDLCSINFDPTACDASGFQPYDSTVSDRYGNPLGAAPAPVQPAPAAPAPAAPAAPAAPQTTTPPAASTGGAAPVTGTGTKSAAPGATTPEAAVTAPAAEAPAGATAPEPLAAPTLRDDDGSLVVAWAAPADGGSAITGYRVALNGGTAVDVPADETEYRFARLAEGEYSATVVAVNAVGTSAPSPASAPVAVAELATAKTVASTTSADAEATGGSSPLSGALILAALVAVGGIVLLANSIRTSGGIAAFRSRFARRASAE